MINYLRQRKLNWFYNRNELNGVPDYEEYLDDKAEYETVIKLIEKLNAV